MNDRIVDTPTIREILDFWLLPPCDPGYGLIRDLWFKSTREFDAEIATKFGSLHANAVAGTFDHWVDSPEGALALLVLCDQFSRNIYRKTARAFAADRKALGIAHIALSRDYPAVFPPVARAFFYMPLCHSEHIIDQELACKLVAKIDWEDGIQEVLKHRDVIAKFGRFPHRNAVLGRTSTPEEVKYLKSGNRWGQ